MKGANRRLIVIAISVLACIWVMRGVWSLRRQDYEHDKEAIHQNPSSNSNPISPKNPGKGQNGNKGASGKSGAKEQNTRVKKKTGMTDLETKTQDPKEKIRVKKRRSQIKPRIITITTQLPQVPTFPHISEYLPIYLPTQVREVSTRKEKNRKGRSQINLCHLLRYIPRGW